jgi:cell division GTPase FtsZ
MLANIGDLRTDAITGLDASDDILALAFKHIFSHLMSETMKVDFNDVLSFLQAYANAPSQEAKPSSNSTGPSRWSTDSEASASRKAS